MKPNDYVFTIPLKPYSVKKGNEKLKWIGTWVNRKDSTISIRYTNPATGSEMDFTWKQRDDPHWFGGHIPAE